MKKAAIIYTRVSTDDQADRGYSLPYQEERLRKYCELHQITVLEHYAEDHSAKNFERPEFRKLFRFCKQNRGKVDLLLFINWSRFSRNTKLTYVIKDEFQDMGIELQAIDQPLDLSVPESKMMLAVYIASNEVENDRRSINVSTGMRHAKKEGRWTTIAPLGYKNIRELDGKALIVPDQNADLIKEAFTEFSKGTYGVEELRLKLYRKGLKCGRARFPMLLRNPVYAGKILVPSFKDELAYYSIGVHEPLIEEHLFEQVQRILEGRAPNRPTKNTVREEFPLRGFLKCRHCGKNISASASRGNGGRYFYYHCTCGCPERFKAEEANTHFTELLKELKVLPDAVDLFKEFLEDKFKNDNKNDQQELRRIEDEIKRNLTRIQNAQRMMLDETIPAREYKEIKISYEKANQVLEDRKKALDTHCELHEFVNRSLVLLSEPNRYYSEADLPTKRLVVESLFEGKLIYLGNQFDAIFNEGLRLILRPAA